jgi:hypothetical protein
MHKVDDATAELDAKLKELFYGTPYYLDINIPPNKYTPPSITLVLPSDLLAKMCFISFSNYHIVQVKLIIYSNGVDCNYSLKDLPNGSDFAEFIDDDWSKNIINAIELYILRCKSHLYLFDTNETYCFTSK